MMTSGCATDLSDAASALSDDPSYGGLPPAPGQASKPGKGVVLSFAVTITIGLILAIWYLGVRMVGSDQVAETVHAAAGSVNTQPYPKANRYWDAVPIAPLYLQAAGIGPKQDANFARSLRAKGFAAQVEDVAGGTTRILIGPFSTRAQMEQVQRRLQTAGVLAAESGN